MCTLTIFFPCLDPGVWGSEKHLSGMVWRSGDVSLLLPGKLSTGGPWNSTCRIRERCSSYPQTSATGATASTSPFTTSTRFLTGVERETQSITNQVGRAAAFVANCRVIASVPQMAPRRLCNRMPVSVPTPSSLECAGPDLRVHRVARQARYGHHRTGVQTAESHDLAMAISCFAKHVTSSNDGAHCLEMSRVTQPSSPATCGSTATPSAAATPLAFCCRCAASRSVRF